MNKVVLIGRLVRDPDVRYTAGDNAMCVANYTLAVDRRFKGKDNVEADFIRCVAFGKSGEFAQKYFHKGIKIAVSGRITTGSYTNRDGVKVYTTDVTVEEQEFVESKGASERYAAADNNRSDTSFEKSIEPDDDGFMAIMNGAPDDFPV